MPQTGRPGPRSVVLAITLGTALSVTLALGVWASSGASPGTAAAVPHASSTGTDAAVPATASPGAAAQLRSMDPAAVDQLAAGEEAAARAGTTPSKVAGGTWLIGDAGTYLVGRRATAGTYESAAPTGGRTCRWAVVGTDGDTLRSGSSTSRSVVTIHKTDGFFQTKDCPSWHKVS